jgi:hypothetical protein
MEITVKIPKKMIREVRLQVWEITGRMPTDQQLEKFFRKDIKFMYSAAFEDGLLDGIEAHFGG